ncbi:MAG: UDP-2,3-diacylglucosamine diphosphatase [bacterium]
MSQLRVVADVHLDTEKAPERTAFFLSFLGRVAEEGGSLYLLGDLFAFWANNKRLFRQYKPLFDCLKKLTASGVKVSFLPGNRDFLLADEFLAGLGIETPGNECFLKLPPGRFYLTHGDELCSDDLAYRRYKETWWPRFRMLDRLVPGKMEIWLARRFMARSKQVIEKQPGLDLKLSEAALNKVFEQGADFIVCGHTHIPEDRRLGENRRLIVLPPWQDSQGSYLLVNRETVEIRTYE